MQPSDPSPTDPKENPVGTGHLPVSGEVGVGPVPYRDPVTTDTDDSPPPDDTATNTSSDPDTNQET